MKPSGGGDCFVQAASLNRDLRQAGQAGRVLLNVNEPLEQATCGVAAMCLAGACLTLAGAGGAAMAAKPGKEYHVASLRLAL